MAEPPELGKISINPFDKENTFKTWFQEKKKFKSPEHLSKILSLDRKPNIKVTQM